MPEDTDLGTSESEEIVNDLTDADADAAFSEGASRDSTSQAEPTPAAEPETDAPVVDDEPEPEVAKPKTRAEKKAAKVAAETVKPNAPVEPVPESPPKPADDPKPEPPAKSKVDPADPVKASAQLRELILSEHGATMVPDVDANGEDVEIPLREWAEKYPGVFAANFLVGQVISRQIAEQATAPYRGMVETQTLEAARSRTFTALSDKGYESVNELYSDPDFNAWVDTQSAARQALFDSFDPEDVAVGLDLYAAATGKTIKGEPVEAGKVDALRKKQVADKAKTDALGRTSMRSRPSSVAVPKTGKPSDEEANALFAEELKRTDG